MRDAQAEFDAAGIKLFAISYDDQQALKTYAESENIGYPLLSDVDSEVIRRYGVINTEVSKQDTVFYGIPFPGVFVTDGTGNVISKFFHDSYKKRDSAEAIIDAVRGTIQLNEQLPRATTGDEDVTVTAAIHGGRGTIRQGVIRKLVVRFTLAEGLHIYSHPVPEGMVAAEVRVSGPAGLIIGKSIVPPTRTLRLQSPDVELQVWSGVVDFVFEIYGIGELV
ncbi:MAG: redoxin domain-containing protein, partial [Gammaproteobacteria bacterium]|nr:redoxin domain-containing protein [Gammaproteobacteria bacterium]